MIGISLLVKTVSVFFAYILGFTSLLSSPPPTPTPTPAFDQQQAAIKEFQDLKHLIATLKIETEFERTLKRGSQGDDVKRLQQRLNTLIPSFSEDHITGYFGMVTEKTIKQFQIDRGLAITGLFDPRTRQVLIESIVSNSFEVSKSADFPNLEDFLSADSSETTTASASSPTASVSAANQTLSPTPASTPDDTISASELPSACVNIGYILPADCPATSVNTPTPPVTPATSTLVPSKSASPSPTKTPTPSPTKTPTPLATSSIKTPTPIPTLSR